MIARLNALLDELPGAMVGGRARELPAFQVCGVAGFTVGVVVAAALALARGLSLVELGAAVCVCVAAFLASAAVRGGRLVLLDQLWLALGAAAGWIALTGGPVLEYLDVLAVGLCWFLAGGRVGCLITGCCHGRPAAVGVRYPAGALPARSRHLAGVRLLPVAGLEAVALAAIGTVAAVAVPFAAPGDVLAGVLIAYGIVRFALEELRGDRRAVLLGLSRPRWMCVAQVIAAAALVEPGAPDAAAVAVLAASALAWVVLGRRRSNAVRLLGRVHVADVQACALAADGTERAVVTDAGVAVAASGPHVSLSLPTGYGDLETLCRLAAAAFPEACPHEARLSDAGVLHLWREGEGATADPDELYGAILRAAA